VSRHQAKQRRPAGWVRARLLQCTVPGPDGAGRAYPGRVLEPRPRRRASPARREEAHPVKRSVLVAASVLLVLLAAAAGAQERRDNRLTERAHQDRDIVYFLQQPETHSFDLYHDYTESREGVDRYLNVVRKGSRASKPRALILDTGENLTA